ncbi:T. brucei spp.-specific protein [Trypanosoma brucei gambiense DAL972]|uniref:T. brucei spp.-specific protein n=2 Tax=Trypanosoma brucei TaxID=5691 RepID=C9ZNH9_TRYB9|nr:T. brucei spp.-specific protein [Trypanosoma brucei gambiense DAL972]RHW72452.1 hypothetical protein DPX39_050011900 [Trypanosoma brucei equiperdum]CBH10957.1 T. brucei spp.-specific protein [Trypanosoma brucei gambiense DAL972]|eukprot:XP_011773244.1 T. brucei spp.-specific protein [Trypanosoma brucei gambiense DAL972]
MRENATAEICEKRLTKMSEALKTGFPGVTNCHPKPFTMGELKLALDEFTHRDRGCRSIAGERMQYPVGMRNHRIKRVKNTEAVEEGRYNTNLAAERSCNTGGITPPGDPYGRPWKVSGKSCYQKVESSPGKLTAATETRAQAPLPSGIYLVRETAVTKRKGSAVDICVL